MQEWCSYLQAVIMEVLARMLPLLLLLLLVRDGSVVLVKPTREAAKAGMVLPVELPAGMTQLWQMTAVVVIADLVAVAGRLTQVAGALVVVAVRVGPVS